MPCRSSGPRSSILPLIISVTPKKWDQLDLKGSIEDHDCKLTFQPGGRTLAVATVGRDRESLEHEVAMERSTPLI
jgi:hypothetical protein